MCRLRWGCERKCSVVAVAAALWSERGGKRKLKIENNSTILSSGPSDSYRRKQTRDSSAYRRRRRVPSNSGSHHNTACHGCGGGTARNIRSTSSPRGQEEQPNISGVCIVVVCSDVAAFFSFHLLHPMIRSYDTSYARFVDFLFRILPSVLIVFLTVPSKKWLNYSEIFQISIPKITEGHKQGTKREGKGRERPVLPIFHNHSTLLFLSPAADTFRIPPANSRRAESTTPPAPMVHPPRHISDDTSRENRKRSALKAHRAILVRA